MFVILETTVLYTVLYKGSGCLYLAKQNTMTMGQEMCMAEVISMVISAQTCHSYLYTYAANEGLRFAEIPY